VNSKGIVAYGYAASSPTSFVGAYASIGTSEQSYTVKSGLDPYVRTLSGANGWGGYSGISVDPMDDSFWVFNQYADTAGTSDVGGFGRWGTAWGRLACAVRNLIALCLECVLKTMSRSYHFWCFRLHQCPPLLQLRSQIQSLHPIRNRVDCLD
jgi:hypothetical protein